MKEFVKDYTNLLKENGVFMKKHWKGVTLLNVAFIGAELAWFYKDQIKDGIKEKFNKEDEAQS